MLGWQGAVLANVTACSARKQPGACCRSKVLQAPQDSRAAIAGHAYVAQSLRALNTTGSRALPALLFCPAEIPRY
jgi:hypothetical protein